MKILKLFVGVLALNLLLAGCSKADTKNPWDIKLPFKTAVIEYSLKGTQNGTAILYVRKSGQERAYYTEAVTKMLFVKMDNKTLDLTTPESILNIDLKKKTAVSTPNPISKNRNDFEKLTDAEKETVVKNVELLKTRGFDIMGQGNTTKKQGEHLGQAVDVLDANGMTIWTLKDTDIPVKTSVSVMGMNTEITATKISLDVDVSDDKFVLPAGVQVQANPMAAAAATSFGVDTLKDPEFEKKMDSKISAMQNNMQQQQSMMQGMPQQ